MLNHHQCTPKKIVQQQEEKNVGLRCISPWDAERGIMYFIFTIWLDSWSSFKTEILPAVSPRSLPVKYRYCANSVQQTRSSACRYTVFACSEVKINLHVATVLHDGEGGNFFLTNMNMRQTLLVYIPNLNFLKIFLENQRP